MTSSYASTEFIDITTADVFLGEIWSKYATIAREANLVFGKLVNRQFEPELQKGQIIRIGNISNLSAFSKSANTAITYETVTETESTITVNQHYYAAFAVEDIIKKQSMQNLLERYSGKLGYALALQEDDTLARLVDSFSQTVGTLATALSDDNLLRADQYLNDANAPQSERYIVIAPAEKANFLKMEKVVNNMYGGTSSVKTGAIGELYGYQVFVSSNVEGDNTSGHDNGMFHREALAIVTQIQPSVYSQYDIDYLCDKVVAQELFGTTKVRDDHGVWMKGG